MALVPRYKPSVAERPLLQQSITVQANANDFGAQIGAGMQNLAQGGMQAADAMTQLRDLEWTNLAKDADNRLAAIDRDLKYGDGGFMLLEGRAAVEGRGAYEAALEEARKGIAAELPPGAAQMFGRASEARISSSLDTAAIQSANGQKKWFADETAARQNTFKEDAVAAWANPAAVNKQIALGQAEIRQQGAMMGWGADTLRNQEVQYISDVREAVAERIMLDDPIAAQSYIEENREQLTGPAQKALAEKIAVPLVTATGMSAAADFFTSGSRDFGVSAENAGQGPTTARAFLMERSVNPRAAHIDGLDGAFVNNLAALMQDAPFEGLGVLSGNRTYEEQRVLWEAELARQGGNEAAARRNVAPPGRSNHNHGQAVDMSYNGKSLKHAPPEVIEWVHANAGKYGLTFPMEWENWHIEPVNARGGSTAVAATGRSSPAAGMPSRMDMERYLETIPDPKARAVARTAIIAQMESASKDAEASRKAIGEQAFNEMVTGNVSPFSFSPEVQSALGWETMNSLTSYWEKMAGGEKITTDDSLLYSMQTAYATDPAAFAEVDLLQYRDKLSDSDWEKVTGWRQTALTDARKAAEDGTVINTAYSASTTALEAAGITVTGKTGDQRVEAAKQIAMFQNVLAQELEIARANNEDRPLNPIETQALINRLLLPVVIKQGQGAAVDPGAFPNPLASLGRLFGGGETDARLFEVGNRPDGTSVDIVLEYQDVPIDMRPVIRSDLEARLGRPATEQEVVDEYEAFLLGQ